MELRIGIVDSPRELVISAKGEAKDLRKQLVSVLSGKDDSVFTVEDDKGHEFLIPSARIAYVDIGGHEERRVGFSA